MNSAIEAAMARAWAVAAGALLLLFTLEGHCETPARVPLTLATATAGGGFEAYGRVLADVLDAAEPAIRLEPRATQGSIENVSLLRQGKVDLALVTGEVAREALAGPGEAASGLRVLSVMYASPGMFAVRADSPYRSIAELRGRPVVFGARGSGLVVLARQVLEGLGLDLDRDFQAILLDRVADAPAMVIDGRAAALWGGGADWPPFVTLAQAGARFIVPDRDAILRIRARHPFLDRIELPAGSYPGQEAALASVGSWSVVLTRAGFDDDLAYRLARALHRSEEQLAARLPRARETRAANTAAAVPVALLHPGARRYLAEIGLVK